MLLSKSKIKKAKDVKAPIKFAIPEWKEEGDTEDPFCFLRHMNSTQRDEYDEMLRDSGDLQVKDNSFKMNMRGFRVLLLYSTMVDDKDQQLFESYDEAREILSEKSSTAVEKIWIEAADLNGISQKAVEKAEKN